MMSSYDRWVTAGPPEWDDEESCLEHADARRAANLSIEAGALVVSLDERIDDLCADWSAEGTFPPYVMAYHLRLCRVRAKAEKRSARREAK